MTNFVVRDPLLKVINTNTAKSLLGVTNNDTNFNILTYSTNTIWNTNNSYKAKAVITLTGNCLLSIINTVNGSEGVLIVKQDSVGNRVLYLPTNSYGNINLNTNSNSITLLEYFYDGTNYYWNSTNLLTYKALNITTNTIANNIKWLIYPANNPLDMYGNRYLAINNAELNNDGLRNTTSYSNSGIYYKNTNLINTNSINFTLSIRAKITFNATAYNVIICVPYKSDGSWNSPYTSIYLNGNGLTNKLEFGWADTTNTIRGNYQFTTYTHDNTYKLITIVKNNTNLLLYINGTLNQTLTVASNNINFLTNAGDICIGSRDRYAPQDNSKIEQLDFLAIWFRALTASEITTLNTNIYSLIQ